MNSKLSAITNQKEWYAKNKSVLVSSYGTPLQIKHFPSVVRNKNSVKLYCPDHRKEQDVLLKAFNLSGVNAFEGLTCCKKSAFLIKVQDFFEKNTSLILKEKIPNYATTVYGDGYSVTYVCNEHKKEHTCTLNYIAKQLNKTGSYLPICCRPRRKSTKELVDKDVTISSRLRSSSGLKHTVDILGKEQGTLTKLSITCNEHKTCTVHVLGEYTRKRSSYLLRCCAQDANRRTYDEWINDIKHDKMSSTGKPYSYLKVKKAYKNISSTDRVVVTCPEHGDKEVYAFSHLTYKLACCANSPEYGVRLKESDVLAALTTHSPQHIYNIVSTASSYRDWRIQVTCKEHGNNYIDTKAKNSLSQTLRYGNFCPDCTKIFMSGVESEFSQRLVKEFPNTIFRTNVWLKGFGAKRLDFYSKEHKLGIEINGVYWHSEDKKGKRAHSDKRKWLLERGVTLLQFTDLEIQQKPDLIISMLKSRMGKNKVVYARKTKVKRLETADAKKFFNENHISGFLPSKLYVGLVYEDKIVSMASFSKARFSTNNNYDFELIRFATLRGLTVVGGLSKLVSAFKSRYTGVLVSYADLRYGNGNAYEKAGFTKLRENAPGYGYFRALKYVSRYQAQKHKLPKLLEEGFDPNKSESENMLSNNWRKIYDAGSLVFVLNC